MSPSLPDSASVLPGSWWATPRLAGPHAFHPLTFLVFVSPVSIGSLVLDGVATGAQLNDSVVAILAGAVVAAALFFFGGFLADLASTAISPLRTVLTLLVFAVTEVVRTTIVGLVLQLHYPLQVISPDRFLSASMTGIALLGTVSVVVNDREEYRRAYLKLSERQEELQAALGLLNRTVIDFLDDLQRAVRHTVDRALQPVIDSAQSGATVDSVVGAIVDVSESVVRPLSHEIQQATEPEEVESRIAGRVPLPSFRRVLHFMSIEQPFQPAGISTVIALLFVSAALFRLPFPEGVGLLIVIVALGGLVHWLAQRLLLPPLRRWGTGVRVVTVSLIYSVPFLLPVITGFLIRGGGLSSERWAMLLYLLLIVQVISWALATVPALRRAREEALQDLENTTHSLAETRARVALRVRRERTRLASVLHGDIQGRLMATALQLSQDPTSKGAQTLLEDLRESVLEHLDRSRGDLSVGFLQDIHDSISNLWEGLVEITWRIEEEASSVIDPHPDTREAIDQVLREAITNAVKHGQSQRVTVSLAIDDDGLVVVQVDDEGRGLSPRRVAGSGERLFEAVTRDYQLTDTGSGTRLEARIPLSLRPQGVAVA